MPLPLNPESEQFIFYDDIVSGRKPVVLIDQLTTNQRKQLVIGQDSYCLFSSISFSPVDGYSTNNGSAFGSFLIVEPVMYPS